MDIQRSSASNMAVSSSDDYTLLFDNFFFDVINTGDAENLFEDTTDPEKELAIAKISEALQSGAPTPSVDEDNWWKIAYDLNQQEAMPMQPICSNLIRDMNQYGICVLDKFMGDKLGKRILNDVTRMYGKGIFQKGELINRNTILKKDLIRKDLTTWVTGLEPNCSAIFSLMQKLDLSVTTCNKMPNNGVLSNYKLHRRTKAMIACYPGDGAYYKMHVDNPIKDGRCITCIYYLNKDWDVERDGGLLRLHPTAFPAQVSNIEPVFDRMIFFWSDRRNPHEVLPAFATRFAITVWYYDADERDNYLANYRKGKGEIK